jgi:UTP--glucose-1-phosphate uridylyltransferase
VLERKGKRKELAELRRLQEMAAYTSVRQREPLGLGHAVLCAKDLVGDEPFIVMLGDILIPPETPCLPQLIEVYERYGGSVLSLVPLPPEVVPTYGIAAVEELPDGALKVTHIVEKPPLEEAPSNLGAYGRYVLTPDIFALLEKTPPGSGGEIQVTDAIEMQARAGKCYGVRYEGERLDTGTPLGLLTTSISFALKRPDLANGLRDYMRQALES